MNESPILREYLEHGRSESCPIYDMHGHIGPFYGGYLPAAQIDFMRKQMKRCGVKMMLCSHHIALNYDMDRGNEVMQKVLDEYPQEFLGYWLINPNHPDLIARDLKHFSQARRFVGFKFWPDYHLTPVNSRPYADTLHYADDHCLLVKVHTFGHSPFNSPDQFGDAADRYPNTTFLMAHCGYGEWEKSATIATDLPNVYLDITSIVVAIDFKVMPMGTFMPIGASAGAEQVNGVIEYFCETAGSEKVVFGSDLPWYSQHYHAGAVLFAHITDDDRHNIMHRNAERILTEHLGSDHESD